MSYFRRCYEAPDDSGAALDEPSVEPDDGTIEPEVAPEPQPETYTREQIAQLLGPRFERFASHEGEEAFRQYGQAYDSATGLIRQGAHLEPQDPSVYERIGIDPSEIPQPAQEEAPGLWGTPWQRPTSYDEVVQYAQSEDADARRLAWEAVASDASTPEHVNRWYFNNWAAIDPAGATLYSQQALQAQQKELADQIREELRAEIQTQYGPVRQQHVNDSVAGMLAKASADIPGFSDHQRGIITLMEEREQRYPGYTQRFNEATMDERIAELGELTLIAANRAVPQAQAQQAAAQQANGAAKLAARTETSRTSGAPDPTGDAAKRKEREQLTRIGKLIT